MILLSLFLLAIAYLGIINVKTYRAFAADKLFAIRKEQRTPEATLLHLARIGGWVGAKIAQRKLRHKTHKQPFGHQLNVIGMLHAACAATFVLVIALLALVPAPVPVTAAKAADAARALPPAGGELMISLRPPAGRPARL